MFTPPTESHRGKAPCEAAAKKMATFDVPVGDTATNSEASALRRCLRAPVRRARHEKFPGKAERISWAVRVLQAAGFVTMVPTSRDATAPELCVI
jgi:hypothetical protein